MDTNIWYFAGGPAAPAIELIYIFCQKMGVELDINMGAVAKINSELLRIRKELEQAKQQAKAQHRQREKVKTKDRGVEL